MASSSPSTFAGVRRGEFAKAVGATSQRGEPPDTVCITIWEIGYFHIFYIFGRIRLGRTLMITSQSRTVHVDSFRDTRFRIKVIKDLRPSSLRYINYNIVSFS